MRKLLNTLYITTPNAYLSKDGNNVVVSANTTEIFRIPITNIESICTFGYNGASPGLMKLCVDNNVSLSFFTPHGRFISRIQGPVHGNILLRHNQYLLLDDQVKTLHLSSLFITGKIYNSRITLQRYIREYHDRDNVTDVESAAEILKARYSSAQRVTNIDELRGIEGDAAGTYFSVFNKLIRNPDPNFQFKNRIRRPPTDIVNAMLSLGYSLLANDCVSALESVGLDPAAGIMHALRPGRNSLALDLMEEMRSYIVDRTVISLINTRQIVPSDFHIHSSPDSLAPMPLLFTDTGLKKFLAAWQNKKKTEIIHPFIKEKIKIGLLPYVQALLLAKYIRQDIDDYPIFLAK